MEVAEEATFNPKEIFDTVETGLAPAARPRFIRVVKQLETTASFKVIKHQLQAEGINPKDITDELYWYDSAARTYSPFNAREFSTIRDKI